MDVNVLRTAVTVLSAVAFVGIWVWAWKRANSAGFAEAAQLPLQDADFDIGIVGDAAQSGRRP